MSAPETVATPVPVSHYGPVRGRLAMAGLTIGYGVLEIQRTYTFVGYVVAWLLRVLAQVLFYGLLGRFVGGTSGAAYLIVGTAAGLILLETLLVVFASALDRGLGTLAMLAATPTAPGEVFISRGIQFAATAVGSATVALVAMPPLLGIDLPLAKTLAAVPALACVALACSAFSATLSAIVQWAPSATWLVINVGYLFVTAFTGVAVPVTYWPGWVGSLSSVLPVRHGLASVRAVYAGASADQVLPGMLAELAVAVGWAALAWLAYHATTSRMRRTGRLDLPG